MRSLLAGVPCTALTATATPAKVAIIVKELGMAGCVQVNVSPHKENIKYNVLKVGKSDDLENNFGFLVDMVLQHKTDTPRMIVFFRQISHLISAYEYVDHELGEHGYVNFDEGAVNDDRNHMLEMYVMKTDELVKDNIVKTFMDPSSHLRIVFCSSSFSMGLNLRGLDTVIHYGVPTDFDEYLQQTGRAGRDENHQAHAIVLLHSDSLKGKNIKTQMKEFVRTQNCRRVTLYRDYVENIEPIQPPHKCCDNCAKNCDCSEDCDHLVPEVIQNILRSQTSTSSESSEESQTEFDSDSETELCAYMQGKPILTNSSSESE